MESKTLEVDVNQGVATVWMNRPELHNAFNPELIEALTQTFRQLDQQSDVRVMVLAGRGKSFSAGADLAWMKQAGQASESENFADAMKLALMMRTLAEMNKPTVARVQGAALGGGMGLASACDICIASEQALFATSEVKFGIIPAAISPYVIRAIGERHACRYFQTAELISAHKAVELGLVHEVVAADSLDECVAGMVKSLQRGGPQSQAAAKDLIRAVASRPVTDEIVRDTAQRIARLRATPEAREGLDAFLAKRPPQWLPKG
ncbi:enoyl-CoA hydratase/isomerase family protein [Orrella marina]|uniref:Enoyl-CoA hydratase n=1 Tax=Orrella marina TaxID=2163011 RepID=A0A2R4XJ67_9BURK|nr:enoyl-CoA hydratase/isomerase family protein [Orrella marina]AWB33877.1 enoyl-CoA hydratase [Orrella marina]